MTPTRITENIKSLLDVIIINKENHINPATVLDLGSQITKHVLCIRAENPKKWTCKSQEKTVYRRKYKGI
jgi:hypothetical protein